MNRHSIETLACLIGIVSLLVGGVAGFLWGEDVHHAIWHDWRATYQRVVTGVDVISRLPNATVYVLDSLYVILPSLMLYDIPQFLLALLIPTAIAAKITASLAGAMVCFLMLSTIIPVLLSLGLNPRSTRRSLRQL